MLDDKDRLVESSRWVVRIAVITNRLFLVAILLRLLLSWIFSTTFAAMLIHDAPRVDVQSEITGLRLLMLLGMAMAIATEVLLTALAQIIASARAGDPFIAANARKLQRIGWALLTLQLLDIPGPCL